MGVKEVMGVKETEELLKKWLKERKPESSPITDFLNWATGEKRTEGKDLSLEAIALVLNRLIKNEEVFITDITWDSKIKLLHGRYARRI